MNFLKKLKSSLFESKQGPESTPVTQEMNMNKREKNTYDAEQLARQKLYEKWLCKDKWLLYREGIPLLFGVNPDADETVRHEYTGKIEALWEHARDCVEKQMLFVLNQTQPESEWEVMPVDLYRWATVSRISIPAEFSALMAFVIQTVKPEQGGKAANQVEGDQDPSYQKQREIVLGAALSLLINAPEQCKGEKGEIVVARITSLIMDNQAEWFEQDELLLSESAINKLIDDYIKLTKPAV